MKNKVWCATRWLDPLAFKGHLHVYWDSVPHDKVLEFSRAEECNQPQHIQSVEAKLRTTWTFVRTPDKFKAWSQVQEVFLALQEPFLEILDHPWHFKQKKRLSVLRFQAMKRAWIFVADVLGEKHLNINPQRDINSKYLQRVCPNSGISHPFSCWNPQQFSSKSSLIEGRGFSQQIVTWYFPQMMAILVVLSIFFSVFRVWNRPLGRWIFSLMHFLAQVSGDRR